MKRFDLQKLILSLLLAACFVWLSNDAYAVPSFARQTNLACNTCHTIFPELKPFGRLFKLNGYTLTGIKAIEAQNENEQTNLKILSISPLSAMVQSSITRLNRTIPGTQNNDVGFPQQLSFFFAGEISPRIGTFIQVTYDDIGASFGWDNTDIRYANNTTLASRNLIYGLTLNNNPTVQDVWNSTPAWGFPYTSSAVAPAPAAATLIDGGLGGEVAGLGAYGFYNNLVYGEFTVYRSAQQGGPHPPDASASGVISHVAPYWRLALQRQWMNQYLEVGTYGLYTKLYQTGISGLTNQYTDIAFDAQYEYNINNTYITAHATYIHEKQDLDAQFEEAVRAESYKLNSFRANANIYFLRNYAFVLGYFDISGDKNTLFYSPDPIDGSRTGKPNSNGIIAQVDYLPWYNTRFSLQYVIYTNFNGASNNYDGYDRKASDNNTLYLLAWLNF
ncbi:MAG: cytochrome C [Calditrichia bacterium]